MKFLKTALVTFALLSLVLPLSAMAGNETEKIKSPIKENLKIIGQQSNYGNVFGDATAAENAFVERIGEAASIILGLVGVIFLFFVVYSGIQWMTAGGNEERITKARSRLTRAGVGLIIIVSAYALSAFVLNKLQPGELVSGNCGDFTNQAECQQSGCEWNFDNEICFRQCSQYTEAECANYGCTWSDDFQICSN